MSRLAVPYPVRRRETAPWRSLDPDEVKQLVRAAPVRHVPTSRLVGYQHTIGSRRLAEYVCEPDKRGPPIVFWSRGRAHVYNGNHRSTARVERGEAIQPARVVDLDGQPEARSFRSSSVLAMHRDSCTDATFVPRAVEDVAEVVGNVAVIGIEGPLEAKGWESWWFGYDNYESILCRFRSAIESEEVDRVLLKIDSCGGDASGLDECCDAMLALKRSTDKRVVAYVDEACFSAAYRLACVADEIYLPRAGGVGSIGVRSGLISLDEANKKAGVAIELFATGSKKLLGDPDLPITDAARARVQKRIAQLGESFFAGVAASRHLKAKAIRALEADVFYGDEAVEVGLADGILSLPEVLDGMAQLDTGGTRQSDSSGRRTKGTVAMSATLALIKARNDARAALKAAKKPRDKEAAADALDAANARIQAAEGKTTKDKKTITVTHESESASSGESSDESSESSESSESESAAAASESAAYESESESGAAAEAVATLRASARSSRDRRAARVVAKSVKAHDKLVARLLAMTGKSTLEGALGKLESRSTQLDSIRNERKEERAQRESEKIDQLLAEGLSEGKITPGKRDKMLAKAKANGVEWLQSFLDDATPSHATETHSPGAGDPAGTAAITKDMRGVWLAQGFAEADFDRLAKEHAKTLAKGGRQNGAAS